MENNIEIPIPTPEEMTNHLGSNSRIRLQGELLRLCKGDHISEDEARTWVAENSEAIRKVIDHPDHPDYEKIKRLADGGDYKEAATVVYTALYGDEEVRHAA